MPYIKKEERRQLDAAYDNALERCDDEVWIPNTVGELTYVFYREALMYVKGREEGMRYQQIAEVLGALEATKQEFYRRVVAPYEDKCIDKNGDIGLSYGR